MSPADRTLDPPSALHETETQDRSLGAVACAEYDATLLAALPRAVVQPLALRGIIVPAADLAALEAGSARA